MVAEKFPALLRWRQAADPSLNELMPIMNVDRQDVFLYRLTISGSPTAIDRLAKEGSRKVNPGPFPSVVYKALPGWPHLSRFDRYATLTTDVGLAYEAHIVHFYCLSLPEYERMAQHSKSHHEMRFAFCYMGMTTQMGGTIEWEGGTIREAHGVDAALNELVNAVEADYTDLLLLRGLKLAMRQESDKVDCRLSSAHEAISSWRDNTETPRR